MRKSKILKIASYIILPILIGIVILTILYIEIKDSTYYNEKKYFESESFVASYIERISYFARKLIYNNQSYLNIKDGDNYIFYTIDGEFDYDIPNMYFLIIYKDKALTNVELTSEVNTIETIKSYIANAEENHKFNIIKGSVEADSEILKKKSEQYSENFTYKYFTRNNTDTQESYTIDSSIEYITTHIGDFEIYTSYKAEFSNGSKQALTTEFLKRMEPYENIIYVAMPISVISIILIVVYLIISVGYKKDREGIILSDFDKIPYEIILFFAIGIVGVIGMTALEKNTSEIILKSSLIITAYITTYVVGAIVFDTSLKRIKSKTFWNTSIIGNLTIKLFHKIKGFVREIRETSKFFSTVAKKFILYCIIYLILAGIVVIIFPYNTFFTIALELILLIIYVYKMVIAISNYDKIERKLKEMYEGNNKDLLIKEEFLPEFYQSVEYLNDISNGFENAIQDRVKSERLKTELITNVSHDIKTPLTSIINYVDLLKNEDIKNPKANEYIEILDNKSQRLKKLIEDLVEVSKVSTGNVKLNLEKINIVELIKQATGEFEDKFNARKLKVIIDNNESEIYVMADSRYMYRIIENLFSNISKYAAENTRVYIDIKQIIDKVYIEIKNISKDSLNISADELMQRFVRGDKSRTTEGSGLGISIAQNLTEIQNGKFNLKLDGDLFKVELIFTIIDDEKN